jgi:phage terminase Nu1 subunit (DNA packaging protein)
MPSKKQYREFPDRVTAGDLANLFNMKFNDVRNLLIGIPTMGNQTYPLLDVIQLVGCGMPVAEQIEDNGVPDLITGLTPTEIASTIGMTPSKLKVFYQAMTAKEDHKTRKMKNDTMLGLLLSREDVEITTAAAFKTIVNFLDILPDQLERDGLLRSDQVPVLIDSLDKARYQLASDLSSLNKELE